jgi:hypothetical protein
VVGGTTESRAGRRERLATGGALITCFWTACWRALAAVCEFAPREFRVVRLLKDLAEGPYKTKHAEADQAQYTNILALLCLGDTVDVVIFVVVLVVGHVEGRQVARCSDVATRSGGSAT